MKYLSNCNEKTLHTLWNNQCEYELTKPFIQIPWTDKTLKGLATLFDVCL